MFFPYYYFDPTMLILIPGILLALWAQFKVNSTFDRFSRVGSLYGYTGAQAARMLLDAHGLTDVRIEQVKGRLSDHYDPRDRVLRLSEGVMHSTSIAALGVAAHEAGHAVQDAEGYKALMLRTAMVPVVNIGSQLAMPLFIIGLIASWEPLLNVGIVLFCVVVAFSLITLPVEFNASKRAIATLSGSGILAPDEVGGARSVLNAAALTYVASAVSAILSLLRLLLLAGSRRDD